MKENNTKENTKQIILKTAMKLFSENGYEKTSMRMIAENSGITKPAVYYYFPDKESLFNGLITQGMEHALFAVRQIAESELSVREKLIKIVLSRFQTFPNHPNTRRFISEIFTGGIKCQIGINLKEIFEKSSYELEKIIQEGIEKGLLRNDLPVKQFIYCYVGAINIYSRDHFVLGISKIEYNEAAKLVDTLLEGALVK